MFHVNPSVSVRLQIFGNPPFLSRRRITSSLCRLSGSLLLGRDQPAGDQQFRDLDRIESRALA